MPTTRNVLLMGQQGDGTKAQEAARSDTLVPKHREPEASTVPLPGLSQALGNRTTSKLFGAPHEPPAEPPEGMPMVWRQAALATAITSNRARQQMMAPGRAGPVQAPMRRPALPGLGAGPAGPGGAAVQRQPFQASWEATQQSFKVTLTGTPKKKFPAGYGEIEIAAPISASGELKAKDSSPYSVGGNTKSGKVSVEVYKAEAAQAAAKALPEKAIESIEGGGWEIDKVEWELGGETGEGTTGSTVNVATGVKFTFKNGQSTVVKAQLFEKQAGAGLTGEDDLSGPSLGLEHTIPLARVPVWSNDSAVLELGADVKAQLALKPNWTKIFAELAKQGGRAVAAQFLRAALTGLVEGLLGAGGLMAGGVLVIAVAYREIESISAIKEARKLATSAYNAYAKGWCASWGVTDYGAGSSPAYFVEGHDQGKAKLKEMVAKIQGHPVYAPFGFTEEELVGTLKEKLREHPSKVWEASGASLHPQAPSALRNKIYTDITLAFYEKRKDEFFTPEYIARKDAIWLARGLGIDESVVPSG